MVLPLTSSALPVEVRISLVGAFGIQKRAVGPDHDRIGQRFVIADADDGELFRIVAGQDGERAASSDDPLVRIADQIFARVEPVEDDVEPFLLVPALLFGVPDEERLMLGKPARFEFERRFLVSGGEIRRQGEEKCKKAE